MNWIKVEDGLPKRDPESKQFSIDVLTLRVWPDGDEGYEVLYYDYKSNDWPESTFYSGKVTHWTYIEAPENGTKEKP